MRLNAIGLSDCVFAQCQDCVRYKVTFCQQRRLICRCCVSLVLPVKHRGSVLVRLNGDSLKYAPHLTVFASPMRLFTVVHLTPSLYTRV